MKRVYMILLALVLLVGKPLVVYAEEGIFETAYSLFTHWQGQKEYPDYICGVWSEDGGLEQLTIAVKPGEEGERGKQEILDLLINDDSVTFVYQTYSYNDLRTVNKEVGVFLREELLLMASSGIDQKSNRVHFNIVEPSLNEKDEIKQEIQKLKDQYGDMIAIDYVPEADEPILGEVMQNDPKGMHYSLYFLCILVFALLLLGYKNRQIVAKLTNGRDVVRNNALTKKEVEAIVRKSSISCSRVVDDRILDMVENMEINKKDVK